MTNIVLFGPGSSVPGWAEELESLEFGQAWGPLDEFEMMWALGNRAFARWRVMPKIGEAELLRLAVSPANRREGMATRLMSECSSQLAAIGCAALRLEVRASNTAAQKLYESLGWRQENIRKAYYSDGEDGVVYFK
jgi:ribosomal protein S18 acetylase RimI-like enzyme